VSGKTVLRCTVCGIPSNLTWEGWPNHCECRDNTMATECPVGTLMVFDEFPAYLPAHREPWEFMEGRLRVWDEESDENFLR